MVNLIREEFEALVERSVEALPAAFRRKIDNVAVVVQDWPTRDDLDAGSVPAGDTLFGIYQGISYPHREPTSYSGALPDRLVIFRGPICEAARSRSGAARIIRETVIHEVGHYFGLTESEIRAAERARARRARKNSTG